MTAGGDNKAEPGFTAGTAGWNEQAAADLQPPELMGWERQWKRSVLRVMFVIH